MVDGRDLQLLLRLRRNSITTGTGLILEIFLPASYIEEVSMHVQLLDPDTEEIRLIFEESSIHDPLEENQPAGRPEVKQPAGRLEEKQPAGRLEENQPASRPEENQPASRPEGNQPSGRPEENQPSGRPEENQPSGRPEENQPSGKPEENQPSGKPEENQPAGRPEENQPEKVNQESQPPPVALVENLPIENSSVGTSKKTGCEPPLNLVINEQSPVKECQLKRRHESGDTELDSEPTDKGLSPIPVQPSKKKSQIATPPKDIPETSGESSTKTPRKRKLDSPTEDSDEEPDFPSSFKPKLEKK